MALHVLKIGSRGFSCGILHVANIHYNKTVGTNLSRRPVHFDAIEDDSSKEYMQDSGLELFESLQKKGIGNSHKNSFLSLYQYLQEFGIDKKTVESQFLVTPDLVKHPLSQWKSVFEVMAGGGMSSEIIFKNITLCPDLLQLKKTLLVQHIEKLSSTHFGKYSLLSLVQRNPQVFAFSPKVIVTRLRKLSTMFVPSDLKVLVRNNPSILTDNWDTVNEKLLYINEVMGLEQPHIAACQALEKSLLHIKIRHQFLYRAGIYKTPNLLRDPSSYRINSELSLITDTSNKFFVNKIARLTEYEYEVFCRMMREEEDSLLDNEEEEDHALNYNKQY